MSLSANVIEHLARLVDATEQQHAATAALLATTQNAQRLRADRPIQVGAGGVALAWAGAGRLTGWTIVNTGTVPALVMFRDARDNHGDPVTCLHVPAGEGREFSHPEGVSFGEGLFVDVDGGPVVGVVWIGAET